VVCGPWQEAVGFRVVRVVRRSAAGAAAGKPLRDDRLIHDNVYATAEVGGAIGPTSAAWSGRSSRSDRGSGLREDYDSRCDCRLCAGRVPDGRLCLPSAAGAVSGRGRPKLPDPGADPRAAAIGSSRSAGAFPRQWHSRPPPVVQRRFPSGGRRYTLLVKASNLSPGLESTTRANVEPRPWCPDRTCSRPHPLPLSRRERGVVSGPRIHPNPTLRSPISDPHSPIPDPRSPISDLQSPTSPPNSHG
jgi:hypothetical protein